MEKRAVKMSSFVKRKVESEGKPTFTEEKFERMFLDAIKCPGIREVVSVYENWNEEHSKCRSFLKPIVESEEKPTFAEEKYENMFQEAIKRPGIREVMGVYENWNEEYSKCHLFPPSP